MNKKALSPVIAISLLVIVSVVAVIGFQSWYQGYQSILETDTEQKSSISKGGIDIQYVSSDGIIYINNGKSTNISMNTIKVGDMDCNINQTLEPGINNISIASCLSNTGTNNILILTNEGIVEEKIFLKEVIGTCTLNSITTYINENFTFYNSTLVPFGESCSSYSQVRICNSGGYSGDDSFNYSSCSVIGQDINPNSFSFTDQVDVDKSTLIYSNTLTPTGYDGPLVVNITGSGSPQLSVNGGAWVTSSTMSPGDTIRLRLTSSSSFYTNLSSNLTLGNYSDSWSVRTLQVITGAYIHEDFSDNHDPTNTCEITYNPTHFNSQNGRFEQLLTTEKGFTLSNQWGDYSAFRGLNIIGDFDMEVKVWDPESPGLEHFDIQFNLVGTSAIFSDVYQTYYERRFHQGGIERTGIAMAAPSADKITYHRIWRRGTTWSQRSYDSSWNPRLATSSYSGFTGGGNDITSMYIKPAQLNHLGYVYYIKIYKPGYLW